MKSDQIELMTTLKYKFSNALEIFNISNYELNTFSLHVCRLNSYNFFIIYDQNYERKTNLEDYGGFLKACQINGLLNQKLQNYKNCKIQNPFKSQHTTFVFVN